MILVDDVTAVMEPADLAELREYSHSLPTGTTIGKRWKRGIYEDRHSTTPAEWYLGEYAVDPDPTLVRILWRKILVVT